MTSNQIGIENFTITEELVGKGGMASVYLCQDKRFVSKKLSLYTVFPWMELYILQSPNFHHKNLVRGVVKSKYDGTYLFQPTALGNLKILNGFKIKTKEKMNILKQLVEGLTFLHSQGVVHGDLKPSNILLFFSHEEEDVRVKISDFGFSTMFNWFHQAKIGSAKYRAPEANEEGWDEKIDIWGLGHILYYLLTQQELFGKNYHQEIKQFSGIPLSPNISSEEVFLWDLCSRMLEPDPSKRIELKQICFILNLPYLEPLSFKESIEKGRRKEVKRVTESMMRVGNPKYNRLYQSIAKQMINREKMPTNSTCFQQIKEFIKILNKLDFSS